MPARVAPVRIQRAPRGSEHAPGEVTYSLTCAIFARRRTGGENTGHLDQDRNLAHRHHGSQYRRDIAVTPPPRGALQGEGDGGRVEEIQTGTITCLMVKLGRKYRPS